MLMRSRQDSLAACDTSGEATAREQGVGGCADVREIIARAVVVIGVALQALARKRLDLLPELRPILALLAVAEQAPDRLRRGERVGRPARDLRGFSVDEDLHRLLGPKPRTTQR